MRTFSHKVLDYRLLSHAKTITLCVTTIAAIFFIFSADCVVSKFYLQSSAIEIDEVSDVLQIHSTEKTIKSTVFGLPFRSTQGENKEVLSANQNSLIPPFNVSEEERIEWFRKKIPEFEIFKSNNLSKKFHSRIQTFFDDKCEVQFFMTWISPAESFGRRDFSAMESLFKVHPHGCLVILSGALDSKRGYRMLKPLVDRGFKVTAVAPDLASLVKNTPAESWFNEMKSGNKDPGEIPLAQNLSNLIRLAALFKYGGIYLDTDFIVLKSFTGLRNSIGAQSIDVASKNWTRLNNAVMVFDSNHPLLFKFIQEFAATFDGNKWGHNGPYLVSRVVERVAGRPGYNFTVLPPIAFYPVDWNRIGGFFKKPENQADSRWVKAKLLQLSGETYGVHLWNKQSSRIRIEGGSVMAELISDHCVICTNICNS
ncbi:hypothetical protein P3X46_008815 [Hevea brasiliensis]|uniref:Alpha 1,4-glycosyltransferase domain-containing protein n=1 Tax=Hevea brasiliensis TaxID=3981 RepID=A0ABQ9MKC8_HEVBR|nr:uncharacterized protein LOC110661946 [Hevea brasiliensis]KAJ9180596.1 hypothetical protein P3X46_008815 [Hevea brasiliensis]